jgi:hypothetical protein
VLPVVAELVDHFPAGEFDLLGSFGLNHCVPPFVFVSRCRIVQRRKNAIKNLGIGSRQDYAWRPSPKGGVRKRYGQVWPLVSVMPNMS